MPEWLKEAIHNIYSNDNIKVFHPDNEKMYHLSDEKQEVVSRHIKHRLWS